MNPLLGEIETVLEAGFSNIKNKDSLVTLYGRVFGTYTGLDMHCKCRYQDAFNLLKIYMKKEKKKLAEKVEAITAPIATARKWRIKPGQEGFIIGTRKRGPISAANATDANIEFVLSLSKEYAIYFELVSPAIVSLDL